jgi:hypothetical protein
MVSSADYGAFYIPWIAVAVLWFSAPRRSAGLPAILVGSLYCTFAMFSYLHPEQYSVDFIPASSARVLLVALICFFFAGIASLQSTPSNPWPAFGGDAREGQTAA